MKILAAIAGLLVSSVFAQDPCAGIPNCGNFGYSLVSYISVIAAVLVEIASGLAVVFVVIGGAVLILNFGNDAQAEKGKKSIMYALIGFAIALSSQAIISFVVVRATGVSANAPHLSIMRIVVGSMLQVFNVIFALVMLFFGFKLVIGRGQQSELDAAKKGLFWAVGGAFAVNLSYALVRALNNLGF